MAAEIAKIPARVTAGIALFDRRTDLVGKDWRGKINVNKLNVASSCDCPVGQTLGYFWRRFHVLVNRPPLRGLLERHTEDEPLMNDAIAHGFVAPATGDVSSSFEYMDALTLEWRRQLRETPADPLMKGTCEKAEGSVVLD